MSVRRFADADVDNAVVCHLAFVATSDPRQLAANLQRLSRRPVMTVGDVNGFAGAGGVLGMKLQNEKIHFEINTTAVEQQGLVVRAQLLQLATVVKGKGASE